MSEVRGIWMYDGLAHKWFFPLGDVTIGSDDAIHIEWGLEGKATLHITKSWRFATPESLERTPESGSQPPRSSMSSPEEPPTPQSS